MTSLLEPSGIKNMVSDEQYQLCRAKPLMGLLSGKHKSHEQQKKTSHSNIHRYADDLFGLHMLTVFRSSCMVQ